MAEICTKGLKKLLLIGKFRLEIGEKAAYGENWPDFPVIRTSIIVSIAISLLNSLFALLPTNSSLQNPLYSLQPSHISKYMGSKSSKADASWVFPI
jgi:hypothetical protein